MLRVSLFMALMSVLASVVFAPRMLAQSPGSYSFGSQPAPYPATVRSGCETRREDNQIAGALVGAVAGGIIGAALAHDDEDSSEYRHNRQYHHNRHYRHHRHHRRHSGYPGHHDYRHHSDGDEIIGAVIGGALGATIGASIASNTTDCATLSNFNYDPAYAPTRSPTGPAWQASRTAPHPDALYGGPADPDPAHAQTCTTVQRDTRLPDGSFIRETLEACRDQNGRWVLQE